MAQAIIVTAGHTFPAGIPVTLAALRKAALPSISISGSIGAGDITAGAITAALLRPGAVYYATSIYGASIYSVTLNPALTGLAAGVLVCFSATVDNTGAVSLDINSLGAKLIKKNKGEDLVAGDIRNGQIVECRYDGTFWEMTSQLGNVPNYYQGTDTGAVNTYTIALSPAPAALADLAGKPIRFKALLANTGAATLTINALAATAIKKNKDVALVGGDIKVGQIVEVVYDGTVFQMTSMVGTPVSDVAIISSARNLNAFNNVATPNDKVDITADEVVLKDASGLAYLASTVSLTLDITGTVGSALGLDAGVRAISTWYYLWLIYNGTAVSGIFSASSTAPTLPTGYTFKALVGAVRNDGSSHFVTFWQRDTRVWINETNVFTNQAGSTTYVSQSVGTIVPPIARTISGSMGPSAAVANPSGMAVAGDANGLGACIYHSIPAASSSFSSFTSGAGTYNNVPLKTAQTLYWKSGDTNAQYRLNLASYTL